MSFKSIALLSVHASPLARLGGEKTGGMNVYVKELAYELGTRGIQVDIFTRRTEAQSPEVDYSLGANVRVIYIKAGPEQAATPEEVYQHIVPFAAGVFSFATRQKTQYDLIYSHYWLSGLVAIKLKEAWGIPFVHMFHTLGQMKNRITTNPLLLPDVRIINEGRIVEAADRLIAATPAEKAQLRWLYRADRRNVSVVSPGVNNRLFSPLPELEAKATLGLSPEIQQVLFVGRIEPLKAVDSILLAFSHIRKSNPELLDKVLFTVIGGRPTNPADKELMRLRSLSRELDLSDYVQFVGAKSQNELRNYYAASLAVVMPSDYESFGMVALEAMACGTPVIASHTGGLAYLIKDGYNGFLVPVRDSLALATCLMTLLQNPGLVQKMRKMTTALTNQYSWPFIADQLIEVFLESLITSPVQISHHMS